MKPLVLALCTAGFLTAIARAQTAPATQATQPAEDITLTSPLPHQVFQRQTDKSGVIHVAGKESFVGGDEIAIVVSRGGKDLEDEHLPATHVALKAGGQFERDVTVSAGGWYKVTVAVLSHGNVVATDGGGSIEVSPVGVGEVFVTGGQSNSTNWGEVKTKSETGMVSAFDGTAWSEAADPLPGVDAGQGKGSPWCVFGDAMYAKFHVPIGIAPVGKGSTSVRQWLPKGDVVEIEPTKTYGMKQNAAGKWESEGTLFDRMVVRMKQLDAAAGAGGHGFRAMLWHQGESDAHQAEGHTLPGKDYRAMLERVIGESRKEVGWEAPWFVATATWGTPSSPEDPDIRSAQAGVVADGFAFAGPDTDKLTGENRQKNGTGVHMSAVGLQAHGKLWAEVVGKWMESVQK